MRRIVAIVGLFAGLALAGHDPLAVSGEWLIDAYKLAISPLQGRQMCNFWPTCSQFTREAIRTRGFVEGTLIGADRLTRCHAAAWSYLDQYYSGVSHDRLVDPVENHLICRAPAESDGSKVIAPQTPAENTAGSSATGFADYLYREQDYARAAAEYLRCAFSAETPELRTYAGLMAAEACLELGDNARARQVFGRFRDAGDLARYGTGRAWFAEARYDSCRAALEPIADAALADRARTLRAWSLFREHRFADGAPLFGEASEPALAELGRLDGHDLSRRSRLAASALALVPGLGHLYAGRAWDGAYSFLTVAGCGLLTGWYATHPEYDRTRLKLGFSAALSVLFYSANIYGANVAAREYNRLRSRQYLDRAERLFDASDLVPDYRELVPADSSAGP